MYANSIHFASFDNKTYHCLKLGAGVLFSNGKTEYTWMSKALEYGASVECVSKLLHTMLMGKRVGNNAKLLMIVDSYGVMHSPSAVERSMLYEHGFQDLNIVFHYHSLQNPPNWYQFRDCGKGKSAMESLPIGTKFKIVNISVKDLVVSPPDLDMLQGFIAKL